MSDTILTHDAGVSAFEDASGVVSTHDDDGVTFSWDEEFVVRVDAPSDLKGAFDTERFYKIEGATVARPIKQPYLDSGELRWLKKPADELRKAAWSFDNAPFTIDHPGTGMVKDVNDVHGFWRSVRYDDDEDRLRADLYVPTNDDDAVEFIEENADVSLGFYNRVVEDYDGDTGDLTDDDGLDGFQVDMYGNHIAGVEHGRCSGEDGCGLDDQPHGSVINVTDAVDQTTDAPSGIYVADDGTWLAVAPSEHTKDSTRHPDDAMFPVDSCSDVDDAWGLRGNTDNLNIEQSTLASRIERVDEAKDCGVVPDESDDAADDACGCGETTDSNDTNMGDQDTDDDFDVPDLSVDALAEKNDAVQEVIDERNELREEIESMQDEVREAFDSAENFTVSIDDDECACEAVEDLVEDLDEKAEAVSDLQDELQEYREDEIEEKLDELESLGAEREEWRETADDADEPIDVLSEEIERRKEVLDAAPDVSVKDIEQTEDEDDTPSAQKTDIGGRDTYPRGYGT